ncbi:MAG: hypothetical protein LJE67_08940 [Salaquimonas sp.]|jgi:hypothetical protein|nr:hypothetical protein [Salaquimonas sp.]
MEAIEQLKTMRDQAKARIEASPDYKLLTKLTTLIDELEGELAGSTDDPSEDGSDLADEDESAEDDRSSITAERDAPSMLQSVMAAASHSQARTQPEVKPVALDPKANSVLDELQKLTSPVTDDASRQKETSAEAARRGEKSAYDERDEEGVALDTNMAIMQAMAELEADLTKSSTDSQDEPVRRW